MRHHFNCHYPQSSTRITTICVEQPSVEVLFGRDWLNALIDDFLRIVFDTLNTIGGGGGNQRVIPPKWIKLLLICGKAGNKSTEVWYFPKLHAPRYPRTRNESWSSTHCTCRPENLTDNLNQYSWLATPSSCEGWWSLYCGCCCCCFLFSFFCTMVGDWFLLFGGGGGGGG